MDIGYGTNFKQIFESAADMPPAERATFLDRACAGDSEMRSSIERLLAADDAAGGFLESSPFDPRTVAEPNLPVRNYVGQRIGAYLIKQEIGSGGMGTVFMAVRDLADITQTVALKIVHTHSHSAEIIRRFSIERRLLAEMEHPGIARLIDAGETPEGLPFLVMEYIAGQPLDEYCDSADLSIDDRLRLFGKVCSAVAYAHRRLIVHRDLKPSNILVTAGGDAKLLDFGIAKLLVSGDADDARTATLMNLLTPAYAAPEQIRGEAITTATDVYSLGVILYELLAGVRPFSFGDKNYPEIVRIICESDPPRPSEANTRENMPPDTLRNRDSLTADRSTGKARPRIDKSLRGDLDNIVLKALRKDPERRYQSVDQFNEDIKRYLKGLPVSARPDTFIYRATKFIDRNRVAVIATGIIVLLLFAGVLGTTWQARRAERERALAQQRFGQVRELANNVIFKYHDAIANLNGSTEIRKTIVEDAVHYLDGLAGDAGTDEDLRMELALAYAKLADVQGKPYYANTGDTAGALVNYGKSVSLLENLTKSKTEAIGAKADEELIPIYHSFSALNSRAFNFVESVSLQQKALDLAQEYLALDPANLKHRLTNARAILWLGDANAEAGDFSKSILYYEQTVPLAEEIYAASPGDRDARTLLGIVHDRIGRGSLLRAQELARTDYPADKILAIGRESVEHLTRALELFEKVAEENPENQKYKRNSVDAKANLGMALRAVGELDRSFDLLQKAAASTQHDLLADSNNRQIRADHAENLDQLALTLAAKNETSKAAADYVSAIQMMDGLIAEDNANMEYRRDRLEISANYGRMFANKADTANALKIFQTSLDKVSAEEDRSALAFRSYAIGLINEDMADCYAILSRKPGAPARDRDNNADKALALYKAAAQLWQSPEVHRIYFDRTPETLAYLDLKIASLGNL